jgi:hypothetical protein
MSRQSEYFRSPKDRSNGVSGSDVGNQLGVYGIRAVAGPANTPGARSETVSWVDLHGHLWLFGGRGQASIGVGGVMNDLWKFYRQ